MNFSDNFSPPTRALLIGAALVIVVAGVKNAGGIIAPLLMAAFIAVACSAPMLALQRRGAPPTLALCIILGALGLLGAALFGLITSSIDEFNRSLPRYKFNLTQLQAQLTQSLDDLGVGLPGQPWSEQFSPDSFITLLNYMLSGISSMLANGLVVFLATLFILTEVSGLSNKLRRLMHNPNKSNPDESVQQLQAFIDKVMRYLALKAATSALTALCVAVLLAVLQVDYIFLWAVLAFFLNFIPYIGSVLAGLPAVLLALIDHGLLVALWAAGGYVAINIIIGNIIETRWMGGGLNLSSLVVFVSLVFWGWVLGPVGMFLSVPLTMLIMIALESHPQSEKIAKFMRNS